MIVSRSEISHQEQLLENENVISACGLAYVGAAAAGVG